MSVVQRYNTLTFLEFQFKDINIRDFLVIANNDDGQEHEDFSNDLAIIEEQNPA